MKPGLGKKWKVLGVGTRSDETTTTPRRTTPMTGGRARDENDD